MHVVTNACDVGYDGALAPRALLEIQRCGFRYLTELLTELSLRMIKETTSLGYLSCVCNEIQYVAHYVNDISHCCNWFFKEIFAYPTIVVLWFRYWLFIYQLQVTHKPMQFVKMNHVKVYVDILWRLTSYFFNVLLKRCWSDSDRYHDLYVSQ